jgi:tetratricopeptide (TPR) repeat protein
MEMNRKVMCMTVLMMGTLWTGGAVFAQGMGQYPSPQTPTTNLPSASSKDALSMENTVTLPPSSKKETSAIKSFRGTAETDAEKKAKMADDFLQKYPESRYRGEVVSWQATDLMYKGQVDKLQAMGEKELTMVPISGEALAVIGSNLARMVNASTPDVQSHVDHAEKYCQKALELLTAEKRPTDIKEEDFTRSKNQSLAVAYSGLGVVAFRDGSYPKAIQNMDQASKLEQTPDAVNYYILGKANEAASHRDAALAAYSKCAEMAGAVQEACKSAVSDLKAHGAK